MSKLLPPQYHQTESNRHVTRCLACGQSRNHVYYESAGWLVIRCGVCGFAWVVDADEVPPDTEFHWTEDVLRDSQERTRLYLDRMRRVKKHQPAPKRWLDVGCGGGGMLLCASAGGWQVEGVEPGTEAAVAASQLGLRVHQGCLAEVLNCLTSREYGVVSWFHVLEHVLDPRAELLLAKDILSSSGVLVIEVPLFGSLAWKIQGTGHRHFGRGHRSYFTMKALSSLLARTGFDVVECTRVPRYGSVRCVCRRLKAPSRLNELLSGLLSRTVRIDLGDVFMVIAKSK